LPLAKIGQSPMQPVERVHAVVIDLHDDVPGRESDILGETAGLHFGDDDAALTLHSEMPRPFRTQRLRMEAELLGRAPIRGTFLFIHAAGKDAVAGFDRHIGLHLLAVPQVGDPYLATHLGVMTSNPRSSVLLQNSTIRSQTAPARPQ